jgi:hypothetical protein
VKRGANLDDKLGEMKMLQDNWRLVVAGAALLLLGSLAFLLLFPTATTTQTVVDISFVLGPGEKYEPPKNGTMYHTKIISKSALTGELVINGGSINLTAYGYNTQHLNGVSVNQNCSFVINPADDLYTFTFDNRGSVQSSIRFILKETWTNNYALALAFLILLASAIAAMALVILGFLQKKQKEKCSLEKA